MLFRSLLLLSAAVVSAVVRLLVLARLVVDSGGRGDGDGERALAALRDISERADVAGVMYWAGLGRQVRIEGTVRLMARGDVDALFARRRPETRAAAWAWYQGEPLDTRADLIRRLDGPVKVSMAWASSYRGTATEPGRLDLHLDLLPDLAGQDVAKQEAAEKAKLKTRIEIDDLKWVMQNKRGRRFVHGILERAGVWRLSFHTNALQMAFNEGSRNEGLALLAKLTEQCPEFYSLMLKEHKDDE